MDTFRLPTNIEAAVLFGSYARNTPSADSDLDVLVLTGEGTSPPETHAIAKALKLSCAPEIAHYTRDGIRRISTPPSLFAWHLRLEGRVLFDRTGWLQAQLQTLSPYVSHASDLNVLRGLYNEAATSIKKSRGSLVYDAGVLAIVVRNAALLLTHFDGAPDFSPAAPLRVLGQPPVPLHLNGRAYALLQECRLAMERGTPSPLVSQDRLVGIVENIGDWLTKVEPFFAGAK
jgi:predicted nucleotidyltransferase